MDEIPWKAVWIVGGVLAGLGLIAFIGPWATAYIQSVLPG